MTVEKWKFDSFDDVEESLNDQVGVWRIALVLHIST